MTLLDRLTGLEEPKFAVHDFHAVNALYAWGDATRAQIASRLNASTRAEHHLTAAEEAQWNSWADNIDAAGPSIEGKVRYVDKIHQYLILAEVGLLSKAEVASLMSVPS